VLVLVNGKRRHTTSLINNLSRVSGGSTPVDIDLIPTNAVGHIEVLRDGAAAQYGSDAISGVINIILDKSRTGGNIAFTGGQFYSKGAPLYQLDADYGFKLGDGGFIHFATEAKFHDRANSSAEPVPYILPRVNGQPDPRESTVDHVYAGGYGRSNRDVIVNSSYDAELPVGAVTLYSFSTFSYRDIKDARGAYIPRPPAMADRPMCWAPRSCELYPTGFQAYRRISERDFQIALGHAGKWPGGTGTRAVRSGAIPSGWGRKTRSIPRSDRPAPPAFSWAGRSRACGSTTSTSPTTMTSA
jgi:iron complex outermembrane receptor protein